MVQIAYLDRFNIDGKGIMWDITEPRIGVRQQRSIDHAIQADKRPDGTFGAAEVFLLLIIYDPNEITIFIEYKYNF